MSMIQAGKGTLGDKDHRIFLVRHGHIDNGPVRRFVGQRDLPLSPLGTAQAVSLGGTQVFDNVARIVASDLHRTLATAGFIADPRGLTVEPHAEMREICLGDWEGQTVESIRSEYADEYNKRRHNLENYRTPGGESFSDLGRRVLPVFQELVTETAGDLAIVTHLGVIRVIICRLLGIPLNNLFMLDHDYGAYTVLAGRDVIKLLQFNISTK